MQVRNTQAATTCENSPEATSHFFNHPFFFENPNSDKIYSICFGNGMEQVTSAWTRDINWNLARVIEKVWDTIYRVGHESGANTDWAGISFREDQIGIFSRDHLKFVVARRLLETATREPDRILLPIIWHTTHSRRNANAAKACKVKFSMNQIPPAPEAPQVAANREAIGRLRQDNNSGHLTEDDFWTAVCLPCKEVRLDYLILYRAIYVYIFDNCSNEQIRPAQVTVYNTLQAAWQVTDGRIGDLWDTKKKFQDFIKNRMSCKGSLEYGYTECKFLSPTGLWQEQRGNKKRKTERKNAAAKALLGFGSHDALYHLFEHSPTRDDDQLSVPFCSDNLVAESVQANYRRMLSLVDDSFRQLPELIKYCSDEGVIASGLLQQLLAFRLEWNGNRQRWAIAHAGGNVTEEQANANLELLANAGFELTGKATSLYKIKAPRDRSGVRS